MGGQRHAPAALSPGVTLYSLYRRLGGPQSRSGQVRKISPSPGFDPLTVQPVASRYTDLAIPSPVSSNSALKSATLIAVYMMQVLTCGNVLIEFDVLSVGVWGE